MLFRFLGTVQVKRTVGHSGKIEIEAKPEADYTYDDELMVPSCLEEIYQRVWPKKSEKWQEDWHSFPLAASAEDDIDWKSR